MIGSAKGLFCLTKKQVPFSMAIGNVEPKHSVYPNTREWDQQTDKEGKERGVSMERGKAGIPPPKKNCPDGLTIARANHPPGSLCSKAVNESPK